MIKKINPNSNVRILWTDKTENWSREREKAILAYITNKYKTKNVRVEFTSTSKMSLGITNLNEKDIVNINAPETQEKIIVGWLTDNEIDVNHDEILRLNKKVQASIVDFLETTSNEWKFKKLTLENFLSYGEKTEIDFEKLKGITLISGLNFCGKTTLINQGLSFLLYNTTDKTKTADEIINKFTDAKFAKVTGELEIEGKDYKIERTVIRNYKKDGTYTKTTTDLKYLSLNENNEWKEPDKEEDRNATEKKIKENIGNMKDFLMTVMVNSDDIFSIIKALPTERGEILSRFLGLEIFEKKETICKEIYNEWYKKSKLGRYNSSDLQSEIDTCNEKITANFSLHKELNKELQEVKTKKESLVKEKEEFLSYVNKDIDPNMVNLTEEHFNTKIKNYTDTKINKEKELEEVKNKIIPVLKEFDRKQYDQYQSDKKDLERKIILLENEIKKIKREILNLKSGEVCSQCGQSLKDVDHTNEIKEKDKEIINTQQLLTDSEAKLSVLNPLIEQMEEEYQQVVLNGNLGIKMDKIEVEIERQILLIEAEEIKLQKYVTDKSKIEINKGLDEKIRLKNIEILEQSNLETFKNKEINNLESNNNNLLIKIDENKDLIETIKKEEGINKIFLTYLNMVGKNGISKTIIKNSVPALNLELQRLLSDSAEFTIEVDINIKNNQVEFWMVDNETGKRGLLISGSGYEKTVAALALRFVFRKINTLPKPSLFIADEIFSTVANINLELIKNFIDKIAQSIDNIFIITHNELVKEWSDHIITVTKENNISKLSF